MVFENKPTEGDIVPIYINNVFNGMAKLISRDPKFIPVRYIGEEKIPPPSKSNKIWVCRTNGCVVVDVRSQDEEYYFFSSNGIDKKVKKSEASTAIPEGYEIIYDNKNWIVLKDRFRFTDVCTQKEYSDFKESQNSSDSSNSGTIDEENTFIRKTRLMKPFDYVLESYDPKTIVGETDRWLVEYLPNPVVSDIENGVVDAVFYKDMGECKIISQPSYGYFLVEVGDNSYVSGLRDLYVDYGTPLFKTHAKITYKLTTGSRLYEPKDRFDDMGVAGEEW